MRRICVVTGTRSEYGLLSRLIKKIDDSSETELQLVVTNMHLSPMYGETYKEIVADGFKIDYRVPIISEERNDALATISSIAKAVEGFGNAFHILHPDILVVLGDRYEILAAVEAALIERVPVAHIHGGEITEGAYDDMIRHAVTKMSHLHFTSTEEYRNRVIQLGEEPSRVFNVGSLGVENIEKLSLLSQKDISEQLELEIDNQTILSTFHPVTLGDKRVEYELEQFLSALDSFPYLKVVFTMPNSDDGSQIIATMIESYVRNNPKRSRCFTSLGLKRYLSVMKYCAAVVGNSSSGIIEAPSFGIPTLNIGDRQRGRVAAKSVVNCSPEKEEIIHGIKKVLSYSCSRSFKTVKNPYSKLNTAEEIFKVISSFPLDNLCKKHFYDIQ